MKGCVFDIQRFSVHDGPGIRTVVFLKGCQLRCFWCQNPEGIHVELELMFIRERCIGCGQCFTACPHGAHMLRNGEHVYLRDRCVACGKCTENCHAGGLRLAGRLMTVDEVIEQVLRDRIFHEMS